MEENEQQINEHKNNLKNRRILKDDNIIKYSDQIHVVKNVWNLKDDIMKFQSENNFTMNNKCQPLSLIFYSKLLIEIGCFICVCILVDISKDDPFKKHIIGDLNLYFSDSLNTKYKRKYINLIINNITSREPIFNESKNISSESDNKRKLFLRKLISTSFCIEIFDDFDLFKGQNLLNIFDLNYSKIFSYSVANLVFSCLLVLLFFIGVYITKCADGCSICMVVIKIREDPVCCSYCNITFYIAFLLLYGTRFVLSFVLFYYMEKGDIEKYDDFLDCPGVKVDFFKENISNVNKLRGCFYTFIIMNFILLGIEKIEKYLEVAQKSFEDGN